MGMQLCKICGKKYRTGRLVFIMGANGRLKGARVCTPCADSGVTVVAAKATQLCSHGRCGNAPTVCVVHAIDKERADKGKDVGGAVKALEAQLKMKLNVRGDFVSDHTRGEAEQLENDIAFLKSGRW